MKRLTYVLFCLFVSIGLVTAQTTKVTGIVTSAEDGEPVIGAAVIVKGTTLGVVTSIDGTFSLDVPASGKTLQVTYIGMRPQEVAVAPNVRIVMQTDTQNLDEVVVTALGISREKKSLGYAVAEVKADDITKSGQMNVTSSLTGKLAGVQVNQFGGTVGASSRISVRGNSSLSASQQPLIVVDGVPIANDTQRSGNNYYVGVDYGSGLNDINPEDIESLTVLKGGSAALYGMRAGNGVILITTKSGKKSKGVSISYDGNITFDQAATIPLVQNKYGQGGKGSEYSWKQSHPEMSYSDYSTKYGFGFVDGAGSGIKDGYDESWGPRLDIGLNLPQFDSPVIDGVRQATPWISRPNNIRDFFQTGTSQNHTVSVLSQSEKASLRASLSYRNQVGTVPETDQRRYTGQFNSDVALNKYVSFEMSANYTRTESDNLLGQGYGGNNPINSLILWSGRQINMQALKDNWDQKDANGAYTLYNWNNNYHSNPYFIVNENQNSYQRDRFFGKTALFYKPFDFLKFEGRVGLDYYNLQRFERHYIDYGDYPNGGFNMYTAKNSELNADFIATFNKRFGDFDISGIAGANYRDLQFDDHSLGANALTVLGVYTIGNRSGDAATSMGYSHIRSNSVYASASLGWKSQLYVDGSVRNDWSSTIKSAIFYPSISASWIPTATFESLKGDGGILSFLKLRGGIAEIGNATSAYRNRATYSTSSDTFNGVSQMSFSYQYPNADLKPESILTKEIGMEVNFIQDRIRFDIAYYDKTATNQILSVGTSNTIGFNSMLVNAGKIKNKGIEIMLSGDILQNPNGLNWTTTFTFSRDRSKIIELYDNKETGVKLSSYGIGWTWGIPTQAKVGEPWGVLVSTGYDRLGDDDDYNGPLKGAIKVNEEGYIQSKNNQDIGYITPDFISGWRNEFSYKNWSFGFLMDLRIGGDIWSQSMSHSYGAGTAKITADNNIREDGLVAGQNFMSDTKFVMQDANGNWVENTIRVDPDDFFHAGNPSEFSIFDGSYLKLREASLSYVFPSKWIQKTKFITKMNVSLIGSNLALLWVHKSNTLRLDPETGGVSSDSRGVGFEQASTPTSRSLGLKLGVTF